jgi:hypothetical protein
MGVCAQPAARERMPRIAPHLRRTPIAYRHQHGAGVRAIVRAGPANGSRSLLIDGGAHLPPKPAVSYIARSIRF